MSILSGVRRGVAVVPFVALAVVAIATQFPAIEDVRWREYAVEKHGAQALMARRQVLGCGPEDLRVRLCLPNGKYGMRVHFWCRVDGSGLCPGVVTTIGGIEKTSFIKPCDYWARCQGE